jgi:hypothetical protein
MTTNAILLIIAVFCIVIGLVIAKKQNPNQNYEDKNN